LQPKKDRGRTGREIPLCPPLSPRANTWVRPYDEPRRLYSEAKLGGILFD
jgi:hypothetical protein